MTYAEAAIRAQQRLQDSRLSAAAAERETNPKLAERIRKMSALQRAEAYRYQLQAEDLLAARSA